MIFQPDFRHFADLMGNRRPARLPLYEHIISPNIMAKILGKGLAPQPIGNHADRVEYFRNYCEFFRQMTYDTVSMEAGITSILPDGGALRGGKRGPVADRDTFNSYPWEGLPEKYWAMAEPQFLALAEAMPAGMKGVGGIGNGVFEIAEDLVGLEYLPFMQIDDPELYADLFVKIGDLMYAIWTEFLRRHGDCFVACRFGDDLGFRSSLLTNPTTLRQHVFPQYKRIIDLIHRAGKPFLYHSCGCIFEVMDDILALGIEAKHSNEDAIAPFDRWIDDYGQKIALLGGFDMDFLCSKSETEVYEAAVADGRRFRAKARGYALGSGNSIPDYVPVENYLAMIRAAQQIRAEEG